MAGFVDEFMKTYGSKVSKDLSKSTGISKGILKQLIPQVAPLILGGLKKQKDNHGGNNRIDHILNKYGSAGVLDNLAGLFNSKSRESSPDPGLGGLLGNSGIEASNQIASKFNIDSGLAMKLIPMLAPVILGALTKKKSQSNVGSGGIGALLDQDGDGNILDDVAGLILGGGKKSSGGLIGGLLGGLLGKK
ncbi:MAG: DUF937 domain-containing protein [Acidobacteriota bacterium]